MEACRRCESPLEAEDLRCAVCALPAPVDVAGSNARETITQVLRCHGCGAAVRFSAEVGAPKCSFCMSVMDLETPQDPIEQAEAFVPFSVSAQDAHAALSAWLGHRRFFGPGDLQAKAAVDGLKPLWWVGWCFEAKARVHWAADSDAGSRSSAWAPHSGAFDLDAKNIVVPASVGLREEECRVLVPHYDLRGATAEPPDAMESKGATIEQFTLQRSAARRLVSQALEAEAIKRTAMHIPGSTYRNVRVGVLPSALSSRHLAFPAYVFAYRYNDKVYRAIVHGQNPDCVLGEAPLSWARVALAVVGGAVLLALLLWALAASLSA